MLYYRIDILEELGINPDDINTWDDINKILPILQNKSLNFGMPVPVLGVVGGTLSIYATLLYQMGGQLYDTGEYQYDGVTTDLNSDAAFDAFKMWTNMFIVHQVPNSYDFANRFRTVRFRSRSRTIPRIIRSACLHRSLTACGHLSVFREP